MFAIIYCESSALKPSSVANFSIAGIKPLSFAATNCSSILKSTPNIFPTCSIEESGLLLSSSPYIWWSTFIAPSESPCNSTPYISFPLFFASSINFFT